MAMELTEMEWKDTKTLSNAASIYFSIFHTQNGSKDFIIFKEKEF